MAILKALHQRHPVNCFGSSAVRSKLPLKYKKKRKPFSYAGLFEFSDFRVNDDICKRSRVRPAELDKRLPFVFTLFGSGI